jgi:replication factor C large subunit
MKPWCEKYRPKEICELAVGPSSVTKLKECVEKKKIAFIHGPTGSGKTTSVEVIAKSGDYELIEMNASDFRNVENVSKVVGGSLKQQSLFNKEKLILIDEVDGVAGNEDRGGLTEISKLITKNNYAVVMVANDVWNSKFSTLRKKSELIDFKRINYLSIVKVLGKICEKENVEYEKEDLKIIARRVGGDIRAAINDLQIHATEGKLIVGSEGEDNEREKEESIFNAMRVVLKSRKIENVLGVYNNVKEDHRNIMLWLDENIPKEYRGEELLKAYEMLSKADLFKRRIMRWQYWRYLVYVYLFMSIGVALAKDESKKGFTMYKRSSRPLKIWMNNQKNSKRKTIVEKLSKKFHNSKKGFIKEDLPYLKVMAKKEKLPDFKLSEEEIEWLKK